MIRRLHASAQVRSAGLIGLLLTVGPVAAQNADFDGPSLGQKPPGEIPKLFGPGVVSTQLHEHSCPSFAPGGREVLWSSVFVFRGVFEVDLTRLFVSGGVPGLT